MNLNPQAKRILCYGDSNTWGRSGASIERYPVDLRWPGLLQEQLGQEYEVIEEGLRSRTTDLDDDDPNFPARNGAPYLRACLESHEPLDLVILWLGTNDLKAKFDRTPSEITAALQKLIQLIKESPYYTDRPTPKILLVSPPLVREEILKPTAMFKAAGEKSRALSPLLEELGATENIEFTDLAPIVTAGEADGVHLEPPEHQVLADHFAQLVRKFLE